MAKKPATIDEYLATLSPANRAALQKVRRALVRKLVKARIAEG